MSCQWDCWTCIACSLIVALKTVKKAGTSNNFRSIHVCYAVRPRQKHKSQLQCLQSSFRQNSLVIPVFEHAQEHSKQKLEQADKTSGEECYFLPMRKPWGSTSRKDTHFRGQYNQIVCLRRSESGIESLIKLSTDVNRSKWGSMRVAISDSTLGASAMIKVFFAMISTNSRILLECSTNDVAFQNFQVCFRWYSTTQVHVDIRRNQRNTLGNC